MRFHWFDQLEEDIRRLRNVSALDAFIYKQFNVHMIAHTERSSGRRTTRSQITVMLMERKQRCEEHVISTEVESGLRSVVNRGSSKCMKEGGELVRPI